MNWKTEIYSDDGGETIRSEYRMLLSTKMSDEEATRAIMKYCLERTRPGTPEEGRLWFALALTQWRYGRLIPAVKEKAFYWMQFDGIVSEDTLQRLKETLLSPMPKRRNFSLPSWARPCPWPEGSLLAYRIMTCTEYQDDPYWSKYVLLRIVRIAQPPITYTAPEAGSRKDMFIALYNWCGDTIPDPSIADTLEFTPLKDFHLISESPFPSNGLSPDTYELMCKMLELAEGTRPEYSYQLDWRAPKGVFTYLGCDPDFKEHTPDYVLAKGSWILSHSNAFDLTLMRRLRELSEKGKLRSDG